MDEDRAHCYKDLKTALLKFDISPETYRQKFRATSIPAGETPTETYHRLRGLYRRWIRPDQHSKEDIGELIIQEQLLSVLPSDVRTWVKEHEPEDGLTAAKLALQYMNARRGGAARFSNPAPRPAQPAGHQHYAREPSQEVKGTTSSVNQPSHGKPLICYYCQQLGHKASVCPIKKTKFTGSCYAPRTENQAGVKNFETRTHKTVTVNGQQVTALMDSGSSTSLIKESLVPVGCVNYEKKTEILCVNGDCHVYPKAEVTVIIDDQPYLLTVGVVKNLPFDVILGTDLPVMFHLLGEVQTEGGSVSCPGITRSQAKEQ
ncbi:PREDICTED: zinc finger protein 394-like, partial [Poecilia mexicana]|uniref:zinc finger protein 394-like n=1 Tax=Poecilia mexicana TaxID=48701 RepID=UPI00072EEC60